VPTPIASSIQCRAAAENCRRKLVPAAPDFASQIGADLLVRVTAPQRCGVLDPEIATTASNCREALAVFLQRC
jgi:hypothetical protein